MQQSSSVLDNLASSLNTSAMEDNVEKDTENVTNDSEECLKGFTPDMPHTNNQLEMNRI